MIFRIISAYAKFICQFFGIIASMYAFVFYAIAQFFGSIGSIFKK